MAWATRAGTTTYISTAKLVARAIQGQRDVFIYRVKWLLGRVYLFLRVKQGLQLGHQLCDLEILPQECDAVIYGLFGLLVPLYVLEGARVA